MEIKAKDNSIIEGFSCLIQQLCQTSIRDFNTNDLFIFPYSRKNAQKNTYVLEKLDNHIKTNNYIGYLKENEDCLLISSRFRNQETENEESGPDYFVMYMLSKVLGIQIFSNFSFQKQARSKIDLAYLLFPSYLSKALRKGFYRRYAYQQYNDSNFKGKVDVNSFLKRNIPFHGTFSYKKRKLRYDEPLIHLIRHTIESMKEHGYESWLTSDKSNQQNIQKIKELTDNYKRSQRQNIIYANERNPIIHAYYHEYRTLQKLCIHILKGFQTDFQTRRLHGFLIDVAWLWEEYLAVVLGKSFIHPMNEEKTNKHHYFADQEGNDFLGEIYPDFISNNIDNRMIADAKYKRMDNSVNSDFHQILAYMFRFDANKGYLIYPSKNNEAIKSFDLLEGINFNNQREIRRKDGQSITVHKVAIKVNITCNTYGDFVTSMEEEEKKLKSFMNCDV